MYGAHLLQAGAVEPASSGHRHSGPLKVQRGTRSARTWGLYSFAHISYRLRAKVRTRQVGQHATCCFFGRTEQALVFKADKCWLVWKCRRISAARFVNLANEGFDLAVRHTSAPPETHVAWVLCDTRSVLVASPDYLQRRGVPAHPSDLTTHDCLLYLGEHAGSWTFVRAARNNKRKSDERVGVNISGSLKANNSEVLRDALLAGLGIGLLPDFSLPQGDAPTLVASRTALPPGGALRLRSGKTGSAAPAGKDEVSTLFSSPLVQVLPDWQVQGFFGERIYALRPWSAQVPKAVQCLVEHLRESFAGGFGR